MLMHHCVHVGMIKDPASRSVMVVAITINIFCWVFSTGVAFVAGGDFGVS